jgi:hypothetical protein
LITIENRVGRLIEARFASPIHDNDLKSFEHERVRVESAVGDERVLCLDLTGLRVLSPEHSSHLAEVLRAEGSAQTRIAIWIGTGHAVLALQLERILRESHEAHRVFHNRVQLVRWFGDVLTPAEQRRLNNFLDGI